MTTLDESFQAFQQFLTQFFTTLPTTLLDIESTAQGYRLIVAADGLSLDEKLNLERQIIKHIDSEWSSEKMPATVYFKRMKPLVPRLPEGNTGPVAHDAPTSPFGLKVNRRAIPGVQNVLLVASGKGGVGKSTVSTNLSVALAEAGYRVGLLDADLYGPSAPIMFGLKGPMTVTPDNKILPLEAHGVKVVSFGFLADDYNPVMLRGPVISKSLRQLCYQTAWGELDFLIVDLPPGTGDVQLTLIEDLPLHGAVVVTTPQSVALADAHKALSMFEKLKVPILGVVENMAYFNCDNCDVAHRIFGDEIPQFLRGRGISLLAQIPLATAIRQGADSGRPIILEKTKWAETYKTLADKVVLWNQTGKVVYH